MRSVSRHVLERILQRELHDSRIRRSGDLAKGVAIQGGVRISFSKAVCDIERLGSKFQVVGLPRLEDSRQSQIQLPGSRTHNVRRPHVSNRACIGLCKSPGIQVVQ